MTRSSWPLRLPHLGNLGNPLLPAILRPLPAALFLTWATYQVTQGFLVLHRLPMLLRFPRASWHCPRLARSPRLLRLPRLP